MAGETSIFQGGTGAQTAVAALAALGGAASSSGQRQVGTGQTYATIQAAITAASNGDEVVIHPGTYSEEITLTKLLTFRSLIPGAAIWSVGAGVGMIPIRITGLLAAGDVRFYGITFVATTDAGGGNAFLIENTAAGMTSRILFDNCTITGNTADGRLGQVKNVAGTQAASVVFDGCRFTNGGTVNTLAVAEAESVYPVILRRCTGRVNIVMGATATPTTVGVIHILGCVFMGASSTCLPTSSAAHSVYARGYAGITFGSVGAMFDATAVVNTERVYMSPADVAGTGAAQNIAHTLYCMPRNVQASLTTTTAAGEALTQGAHTITNVIVTAPVTARFRVRAEG